MDAAIDPSLVLKTTPPKLRKSLLERERLRRIRADGEDVAVFLVEAPAGNGKTSLLAQWRLDWLQSGAVVAWLNMDSEDSPIAVVSGIVLGLRRGTGLAAFGTDAIEAVRRGAGTHARPDVAAGGDHGYGETDRARSSTTASASATRRCWRSSTTCSTTCRRTCRSRQARALAVPLHTAGPCRPKGTCAASRRPNSRFDLPETIRLLSARLGERVNADLVRTPARGHRGLATGRAASGGRRSSERPIQAQGVRGVFCDHATTRPGSCSTALVDSLPPALAAFLTRCALLDAMHPSLCEAVTWDEDAGAVAAEAAHRDATADGNGGGRMAAPAPAGARVPAGTRRAHADRGRATRAARPRLALARCTRVSGAGRAACAGSRPPAVRR